MPRFLVRIIWERRGYGGGGNGNICFYLQSKKAGYLEKVLHSSYKRLRLVPALCYFAYMSYYCFNFSLKYRKFTNNK